MPFYGVNAGVMTDLEECASYILLPLLLKQKVNQYLALEDKLLDCMIDLNTNLTNMDAFGVHSQVSCTWLFILIKIKVVEVLPYLFVDFFE